MAELREIPPERLKEILEVHRKWVESGGKEGERADLREANLRGVNLREANLQGAYMIKADLRKADLVGANLQEANLREAYLQNADLFGANLQKVDLGGAKGLTAPQVKQATNWELAFYDDDFLKELDLPPDHNLTLKKKLAEREKEKKETTTKK